MGTQFQSYLKASLGHIPYELQRDIRYLQKAQLSRHRAPLSVVENFAKLLKMMRNYTV